MMLRRAALFPLLQSWPGWVRWAASSPPQAPSSDDSMGQSLLQYWRGKLDDRQRAAGDLGDDEVRQLLHTSLRLRQGKVQSSLPEELMAVFVQYYRQLDRQDRLALFRSLTSGLGVQLAEVDAAASAWQQLRHSQAGDMAAAGAGAGGASSSGPSRREVAAAATEAAGASASEGPRPAAAKAPAPEQVFKAAERLAAAVTPLYSRLFVPLSQQPQGIKFLVDMRADLLQSIREHPSGAAPLRALSDALRSSLAEWFSVGLLQLRRISWEGSSAALLEKVAAGEAVHEVSGWADLKGRLDARDRRVYAFFHEAMPGEPLVVLHTALTSQLARSMHQLLPPAAEAAQAKHAAGSGGSGGSLLALERTWQQPDGTAGTAAGAAASLQGWHAQHAQRAQQQARQAQQAPSVAVFYSISATQPGLAGVDLGNFLIKQVAHSVQAEFPSVGTLCTLSPLPGFSDWLRLQLARVAQGLPPSAPLLLPAEAAALEAVAAGHLPQPSTGQQQQQQPRQQGQQQAGREGEQQQGQQQGQQGQQGQQQQQQQGQELRASQLLRWAVQEDAWLHSTRVEAAVQAPVVRLAAYYLLRERRRGLALDPVANFHLRNGASVLHLNWRADLSTAGLRRSHGIMVNYLYELDRLQEHNRAYLADGRVTAAPEVEALLQPVP